VRAEATSARRDAILAAALASFAENGYAATTMADVRRRSGASVGSIYHHFAGKEDLAAALLLEGLRDYQAGLLRALRDAGEDAEEGVRAVVSHHLAWVAANQDLARLLLAPRDPAVRLAGQGSLRELNRPFFAAVESWRRDRTAAGALRPLPFDVFHAVLLGPAQELSRHWLAGRLDTPLPEARAALTAAAWAALKGAP
jgi:AcrR family transcriptional regulator